MAPGGEPTGEPPEQVSHTPGEENANPPATSTPIAGTWTQAQQEQDPEGRKVAPHCLHISCSTATMANQSALHGHVRSLLFDMHVLQG